VRSSHPPGGHLANVTLAKIEHHYPHRVEMNRKHGTPETCPVCCGDTRTTDHMFAGPVVRQLDHGGTLYECAACPVWASRSKLPEAQEIVGRAITDLGADAVLPRVTDLLCDNTDWSVAECREIGRRIVADYNLAFDATFPTTGD
jgi:hypothetical protein